jgi:hypothetical protein
MAGDVLNTLDVGDGRAAELHDKAAHGVAQSRYGSE